MSADVYDKALTAKIKNAFNNTIFQDRERTFKTVTDKGSKVTFPLISIFRPDGWSINTGSNTWATSLKFLDGFHGVKVDLVYAIDVYANSREELEEITSELVLYLLRSRGINVTYYSADKSKSMDVKTTLEYVSGPERTSELDDETVGRPYRYTLTFKLENAYIYEFAGEVAGEVGFVPKVTEVIVEIRPEVNVTVESEGDTHKTEYIHKEVIYGKN